MIFLTGSFFKVYLYKVLLREWDMLKDHELAITVFAIDLLVKLAEAIFFTPTLLTRALKTSLAKPPNKTSIFYAFFFVASLHSYCFESTSILCSFYFQLSHFF